jgi:hypothetical protein
MFQWMRHTKVRPKAALSFSLVCNRLSWYSVESLIRDVEMSAFSVWRKRVDATSEWGAGELSRAGPLYRPLVQPADPSLNVCIDWLGLVADILHQGIGNEGTDHWVGSLGQHGEIAATTS